MEWTKDDNSDRILHLYLKKYYLHPNLSVSLNQKVKNLTLVISLVNKFIFLLLIVTKYT